MKVPTTKFQNKIIIESIAIETSKPKLLLRLISHWRTIPQLKDETFWQEKNSNRPRFDSSSDIEFSFTTLRKEHASSIIDR